MRKASALLERFWVLLGDLLQAVDDFVFELVDKFGDEGDWREVGVF